MKRVLDQELSLEAPHSLMLATVSDGEGLSGTARDKPVQSRASEAQLVLTAFTSNWVIYSIRALRSDFQELPR